MLDERTARGRRGSSPIFVFVTAHCFVARSTRASLDPRLIIRGRFPRREEEERKENGRHLARAEGAGRATGERTTAMGEF